MNHITLSYVTSCCVVLFCSCCCYMCYVRWCDLGPCSCGKKAGSYETPDVTPCRTSPPMQVFRIRLARNTRCNTMSHLIADAGFSYTSRAKRLMWHHVTLHRHRVYVLLAWKPSPVSVLYHVSRTCMILIRLNTCTCPIGWHVRSAVLIWMHIVIYIYIYTYIYIYIYIYIWYGSSRSSRRGALLAYAWMVLGAATVTYLYLSLSLYIYIYVYIYIYIYIHRYIHKGGERERGRYS